MLLLQHLREEPLFKNRLPRAIRKPEDGTMARSDRHGALMCDARNTSNTATAHSPSPEVADSNDGHAVDERDRQTSSLRMRMGLSTTALLTTATPASSLVHPGERQTPASSSCHMTWGFFTNLNREEEMLDGHEWQAQHIVGERQTPSGLEYEARVEKTV
jgi:hypothetical protein